MRSRFALLLVVLLALPLLALAPRRHAYHASILELRLNPEKQQVELALKVFSDDLTLAISKGQPAPVALGDLGRALPLVAGYLKQTLAVGLPGSARGGSALPLQFLGMQAEKDAHWLYARVALPRPVQALTLRNAVLLDVFPADQLNIVNAELGAKKQSLLFRRGQEEQAVTFEKGK